MALSWIGRRGAALAACAVLGCGPGASAELKVLVTIKPVHSLVAAVMDGAGQPDLLIDGAASPHAFAMKPSDVRRLHAADMIVRVSSQLEVFLAKPLAVAAKRATVLTLDEVPGLDLHDLRSGSGYEAHDHDHGPADAPKRHAHNGHGATGHGHSHGKAEKAAKGRTNRDPHLWLDPANARIMALAIGDILAEKAPPSASLYRANAARLAERLDALDARLAQDLASVAGRPYLVFHDAYQYFERRYGLAGVGSVTVNPEVPPSAQRLSRIRSRLAKSGVACVFAEPQFPPRAIDTIIEGSSVRRGVLDPLGAGLPAGSEHYFGLMDGIVRDLKACLGARA